MSVLPQDVLQSLSQLLQALSSADNSLRGHAEEQLNNEWVVARPDFLLMGLVEHVHDDPSPIVRTTYNHEQPRMKQDADLFG